MLNIYILWLYDSKVVTMDHFYLQFKESPKMKPIPKNLKILVIGKRKERKELYCKIQILKK